MKGGENKTFKKRGVKLGKEVGALKGGNGGVGGGWNPLQSVDINFDKFSTLGKCYSCIFFVQFIQLLLYGASLNNSLVLLCI